MDEDERDSLQLIYNEETKLRYKASPKTFLSMFGVDSNTKVFFYPKGAEYSLLKGTDQEYGTSDISYFSNDTEYQIKAYASEKDSSVASVVTVEGGKAKTMSTQTYIMILTDIAQAVTEDGEIKTKIEGYYQGALASFFLQNESILNVASETGKKAEAVDVELVRRSLLPLFRT